MTRLSQELRAPVVSHDVKLIPSDQTLKWLELGRHPQYATDNDATTRRDLGVSAREGAPQRILGARRRGDARGRRKERAGGGIPTTR